MLLVEKSATEQQQAETSHEPELSIKVQQIRWQLQGGIYPVEDYLEQALDRVLEDLLKDRPQC